MIDQDTLDTISQDDPSNIDRAELQAIEEMKDYLNVRYDPAAIFAAIDRNQSVVLRCIDILLYHLHSSVMPDNIPTLRVDRYKEAVGWLEKVADGFIAPNLPVKEEDPTNPLRWGSSQPKTDQYF